jgi:hypothetical protein
MSMEPGKMRAEASSKSDTRPVLAFLAAGLALAIVSTFAVALPFHGVLGWPP